MSKMRNYILIGLVLVLAFGLINTGLSKSVDNNLTADTELMQTSEYKYKTTYLHNDSATILGTNYQYTFNNTKGENAKLTTWVSGDETFEWTMSPTLAGDLNISGTSTFYIWASQKNAENYDDTDIQFDLSMYELSSDGSILVGQTTKTYDVRSSFTEYSIDIGVDNIFNRGNSIRIELSLTHSSNRDHKIAFGSDSYPSRLELRTSSYAHASEINSLNSTYQNTVVYDVSTADKTAYFNTTISDPFGGYDIEYVNVTLMDPQGDQVFYRQPMTKVSGTETSHKSNYTYQWNYSGFQSGEYTAVISVVDLTGYFYRYPEHPGDETYGGQIDKTEHTFWIGGRPLYVNFQTVDSKDNLLTGARIAVEDVGDGYTDEYGIHNFTMSPGTYNVSVYWQDTEVKFTQYTVDHNISRNDPVRIGCDVYYPSYKVLDSNGVSVESARVFVTHPNGTLIRKSTNSTGVIELYQVPSGDYEFTTLWRGKEVNNTDFFIDDNQQSAINGRIYQLDLLTVDDQGEVVTDVQVTIRYQSTQRIAESKLTNSQGRLTVRLPGTESGFRYEIESQWHGINVGKVSNYQITDNDETTIYLDIYEVDFNTVDKEGETLGSTSLNAYTNQTGDLANTIETDPDGHGSMKLPRGYHTVDAYWNGIYVGSQTIEARDGLSTTIEADVYHVTYHLVDERGGDIANSTLEVSYGNLGLIDSKTTDVDGRIDTRLPAVELDLKATWKGLQIYDGTDTVDSNEEKTIECSVYYLTVRAEDDLGEPLENSNIQITVGDDILAYRTTDSTGHTNEMRLPGHTYDVKAFWKGLPVYSQDLNLVDSSTQTIETNVYHTSIVVEDDLSQIISDAEVEVYNRNNLLSSGVTEEDGGFDTKLPQGEHRFMISWRNVEVYDSQKQVIESGSLVLQSNDVYHVTFHMIDSRDESVSNASMSLSVDGEQFSTGTSNGSGMFQERIPTPVGQPGEIETKIYWKKVVVYDGTVDINDNSLYEDPKELELNIFYLNVSVDDNRENPVGNAKIIDRHSELPDGESIIADKNTNDQGETYFRLPRGEQTFEIIWKDITVKNRQVDMQQDETINIDASVYYLDISIVDDKGEPVPHSLVDVTYQDSDKLYQSNYANTSGDLEVRIPASTWDIKSTWFDTVVHEQEHEVTSDESTWSLEAEVDVYYLEVKTLDKDGEKLSGVHLIVQSDEKSWSGYTSNGNKTFRLPAREYTVKGEFKDTYMLTKVNVEENKQVEVQSSSTEKVKFNSYPQPVYTTNLFFFLLIILVILIIFGYILKRLAESVETEEEAEEGSEESSLFEEEAEDETDETSEEEIDEESTEGEDEWKDTEDEEESVSEEEISEDTEETGNEEDDMIEEADETL